VKVMSNPYLQHLRSGQDLRTSYEAIRAGFVQLALEKNRRATPFVAEARALKAAASVAKAPIDLLKMSEIRPALLTASGISDKALQHLSEDNQTEAIGELIRKFLEPSGSHFVEELVFRFLLTRGDTLGGSMRNAGGSLAQRKLIRAIIACLRISGVPVQILRGKAKFWESIPLEDADIELGLRGLSWVSGTQERTLVLNLTVPLVKNNVDICLLRCSAIEWSQEIIGDPARYIALGELKGGIDPAGADEHWKTAVSALKRISDAFAKKKLRPQSFFVGGAIEAKMANEIWEMLRDGRLQNAANLTEDGQISSISRWLCSI